MGDRSKDDEYQIWLRIRKDSDNWDYESFKKFYNENNPGKLLLVKINKSLKYSETNIRFVSRSEASKGRKPDHEKAIITNMKRYGVPHYNRSNNREQVKFGDFLKTIGAFDTNTSVLDGKEIDYFSKEMMFGVEYNGIYYHSEEKGRHKFYHYNKYDLAAKKCVSPIQVWSCDWLLDPQLTKDKILWFLDRQPENTSEPIIGKNTITIGQTVARINNGVVEIDFDFSMNSRQDIFQLAKTLGSDLGYEKLIFVSNNDFPLHRKFDNLEPVIQEFPSAFFVQKSNSRNKVSEGPNTSKIWDCGKTICEVK